MKITGTGDLGGSLQALFRYFSLLPTPLAEVQLQMLALLSSTQNIPLLVERTTTDY